MASLPLKINLTKNNFKNLTINLNYSPRSGELSAHCDDAVSINRSISLFY